MKKPVSFNVMQNRLLSQWRYKARAGEGAKAPNLAQAPKFLIGSIVISLSRCCLPNDEGPAPPPQYFS